DPAGEGLIVTLSIPIYTSVGTFKGVIGADVQLSKISAAISGIKLGESGFSFLVDKNGRIISMPEKGYAFFDLQHEEVPVNQSPKQTLLDTKLEALQQVAQQIINGGTGLQIISVNKVDNYVAINLWKP
ncbi:MAG: hypothetical protein IPL27_22115, partial [Lewinellaceae bacterium]|nr:hypothetical protein [Lewinellaceae bacterium]